MKLNSGAHAAQPFWMPPLCMRATHSIVQGWNHFWRLHFFMHCCTFEYIIHTPLAGKKRFAFTRWVPNIYATSADLQLQAFGSLERNQLFAVCMCKVQPWCEKRNAHRHCFEKDRCIFMGGIMQLWHWVRKVLLSCDSFMFGQKFQGRHQAKVIYESP